MGVGAEALSSGSLGVCFLFSVTVDKSPVLFHIFPLGQ